MSAAGTAEGTVAERHREILFALAAKSIRHGFAQGKPLAVDLAEFPEELRAPGACFVTAKIGGNLRGCIGSPQAWRPLALDVAERAFDSCFKDPRFPPLAPQELPRVDLSISVLTPPEPMRFVDEADLLAQIRPGIDGLIFEDRGRRGLFLPAVWESLPEKKAFLAHLKQKAGLAPAYWSPTVKVWRFAAEAVEGDHKELWAD